MMFAVASVKRAETAFPGLHGAVEVVTRGRHVEQQMAENERKQAEKQAEPDMEETWDLSDPADPLNIGMGWGTGGHGLGL